LREFAESTETEDASFQIIGILAVQRNLHSVLVTPRDFFNDLVEQISQEASIDDLSEEELKDVHTLVSERVSDVPPYEEWKAARERFEALDPAIKQRKKAAGLIAMLLMPEQAIHPLIWRELLQAGEV
jgi:hypothetical protein